MTRKMTIQDPASVERAMKEVPHSPGGQAAAQRIESGLQKLADQKAAHLAVERASAAGAPHRG